MGFFSSIGNFVKDAVGKVGDFISDNAGDILSTGGKLLGGILGNNSASDVNASNQAFAHEQFLFNKDYIQNQLQWRVSDAKKAGVHPLAAIGIQSPGFSSVSSSSTPLDYSWIGDLGQSANYGATKAKSSPEQQQMINLQIRGMELDNEYKQAQIDQMKVDTLASTIASNQAFASPPSPRVNQQEPTGLPSGSDVFSVRHIRDNDYDINYNQDYQGELGDEAGQLYNLIRKATRENAGIWTDPKDGRAYVYDRNSGWWHRLDALSVEEAHRLLGKPSNSSFGFVPVSSSHRVRNSYRYRD